MIRRVLNLFPVVTLVAASLSVSSNVLANIYNGAPPEFKYRSAPVVPVSFHSVDISYTFDARARVATARAVVVFDSDRNGQPMLDLVPNPTRMVLNDKQLATNSLVLTSDPTRVTQFRVLTEQVEAGSRNTLELDYQLRASDVTFLDGRVRSGFFMSDLAEGGRRFFEQFGPANFEFDQVSYRFDVRVINTTIAHEIFANGELEELSPNHWRIEFPDYFTTSSLYFHLTDARRFFVHRFTYQGVEASIPVTIYASTSALRNEGTRRTRLVMAELEQTYGAYLHDQILVYVTSGGGGMEYGGATMTSLGALGHEFTHFWFARGVMPANGNAGWIDEAIASWRDNGYPRATHLPNRAPVNLASFSDYRRHTPRAAYTLGARLMSELDFMFRDLGGLRPILRQMYSESQAKTITTADFQVFLESHTGRDLGQIFARYVYGRNTPAAPANKHGLVIQPKEMFSAHPRPYTDAELKEFR